MRLLRLTIILYFVLAIGVIRNLAMAKLPAYLTGEYSAPVQSYYQDMAEISHIYRKDQISNSREFLNIVSNTTKQLLAASGSGKFVSVGITAEAGIGVDQQLAFALHGPADNLKLGVFCVGGNLIATSVGVGITGAIGQTMACKDNPSYEGAFINIELGVTLGIGGALQYSIGADIHGMLNYISDTMSKMTHKELTAIKLGLEREVALVNPNDESDIGHSLLIGILMQTSPELFNDKSIDLESVTSSFIARTSKDIDSKNLISLGKIIRESAVAIAKRQLVEDGVNEYGDMSFYQFMMSIAKFFTGCDSIQAIGKLAIGKGAGFSFSINDYVMAGEISVNDVKKVYSRKNPKGHTKSYKQSLKDITSSATKIIKTIPRCSLKAQGNAMSYTRRLIELARGENIPFYRSEL